MKATTVPITRMISGSSRESRRARRAFVSSSIASAARKRRSPSAPLSSPTATICTSVGGSRVRTERFGEGRPSTTRSAEAVICSEITTFPTTGATIRSARSTGIPPEINVDKVRANRERADRCSSRPRGGDGEAGCPGLPAALRGQVLPGSEDRPGGEDQERPPRGREDVGDPDEYPRRQGEGVPEVGKDPHDLRDDEGQQEYDDEGGHDRHQERIGERGADPVPGPGLLLE